MIFFQFPSNDSYKFSPFADLLLVEVDPHVKETKVCLNIKYDLILKSCYVNCQKQ
jgi:hypothetical protein